MKEKFYKVCVAMTRLSFSSASMNLMAMIDFLSKRVLSVAAGSPARPSPRRGPSEY